MLHFYNLRYTLSKHFENEISFGLAMSVLIGCGLGARDACMFISYHNHYLRNASFMKKFQFITLTSSTYSLMGALIYEVASNYKDLCQYTFDILLIPIIERVFIPFCSAIPSSILEIEYVKLVVAVGLTVPLLVPSVITGAIFTCVITWINMHNNETDVEFDVINDFDINDFINDFINDNNDN